MIILYCLLAFVVIIMQLVIFITYGGFVSKQITDVYMNLDESELRLNTFNPSILATNCYIAKTPFNIFSKYYINGQGTVPRWSKLHKRINEYYAIALRNET